MDSISNFLTSIRNAEMAGHSALSTPAFKLGEAIAAILKNKGFIADYSVEDGKINITLAKRTKTHHIKQISKPGRRMYVNAKEIPTVLGGRGIVILTTPKGVLSGQDARKNNVGGELICEVY